MKLGSVAAVRSGLVLSRKQAREPSDIRYPLLNLRCMEANGSINLEQIDIYDAKERLPADYLSQAGDVVVRLSAPYTAVLIDERTSDMVVSSNFVTIRTDRKCLLPEYLFWLLNTPKVKRQIYENTSSNMLGAIKAKYFTDFELYPLPVADQEKIAALNSLARRENQLLKQLAEEKEKLYKSMIDRVQKKMRRGNAYDDQK